MLVAHVLFFIYHCINLIHIHSSHDNILHRPSLTHPLGFHLFLIRLTLVFLLQKILLMFPPFIPHQPCSIILVLKGLYNEILPIFPLFRPKSLISSIQLPNYLIFHVLILLMDGLVSPSKMRIALLIFVLLILLKFWHCMDCPLWFLCTLVPFPLYRFARWFYTPFLFVCRIILPINFFPTLFHQLSPRLLTFNVSVIALHYNHCQLRILGIQLTNRIPTRKFSSTISHLMLHLINPRSSTSRKLIVHLFPVINLVFLNAASSIMSNFPLLTNIFFVL